MRSKRIQLVAGHAEQIEQKAIKAFAEAQQMLEAAKQQLETLQGYREEYGQQRVQPELSSMSSRSLQNYQFFLESLGQTIVQARLYIEEKTRVCEQQRLALLACRSRRKALDTVVEKYQQQELKQQDKIEQKEQDEHAQFQHYQIKLKPSH